MDFHNKEEKFWIYDLCELFRKINFIPYGDVGSGSRLNAVTRLVVLIYIIMIALKFRSANLFLLIALIFILAVYFCFKTSILNKINITKENFETLSLHDNKMSNNSKNTVDNLEYTDKNYNFDYSNNTKYSNKAYNSMGRVYGYEYDPDVIPQNVVNSKYMTPNTKRDAEAGIQYYTPNHGINKSMFIEPLIIPRSLDREFWSNKSTYPSGMNVTTFQDTTEGNNFPEGVNRYALYRDGEVPYTRDNRSIYSNEGSWIQQGEDPMVMADRLVQEQRQAELKKQQTEGKNIPSKFVNNFREIVDKPNFSPYGQIAEQDRDRILLSEEIQNSENKKNNIATKYVNNMNNTKGVTNIENVYKPKAGSDYYALDQTATLHNKYGKQNVSQIQSIMSDAKDANFMIEPSPTYTYTDSYFNEPQRRVYMQDIQPNIYSYSVDQEPINNNIGISWTPQITPRFRDQVYNENQESYPLYTRVDPQLVRDQGTPGQMYEQPERGPWSAKYAEWNPPAGTVNFEDIYDPRFTSYGDPYRSYTDVNLGQVQYYYSDVDAYRRPNFIIRSKVDFVDFHDPMGKTKPYYERYSDLKDVKDVVQNRFDADQLSFREDLMSLQMQKRNSEMWQLREAPLQKGNYGAGINYGPSA